MVCELEGWPDRKHDGQAPKKQMQKSRQNPIFMIFEDFLGL